MAFLGHEQPEAMGLLAWYGRGIAEEVVETPKKAVILVMKGQGLEEKAVHPPQIPPF